MEPIVDMRVSRMGPIVEGNLVELVDMVKQIGRQKGTDLTESENRKMVGYLGNLDEMRQQIVIMIQRYEDDSKVLKRLLDLLDRIDDVRELALHSNEIENENDTIIDASDKEIAKQYDTPFNPLMVSTLNILDVSGLFATNINEEDLEEDDDEEEVGDEYWDHEDDLADLAPHDDTPKDVSSINLSVSSLDLPDLYPSPLLRQINDIKGKSKLSSSCSDLEPRKNKGKQPIRESTFSSIKGKGKGKEPVDSSDGYSSDGSDISEKESEEESGPNGASSSQPPPPPRSTWRHGVRPGAAFAIKPLAQRRTIESFSDSSASYSSSESSSSESEIENTTRNRRNRRSHNINNNNNNSSIPVPPPMPPSKRIKKKGPCNPVLCKICYDEYNMLEHIWEFKECKHVYCRECLQDYLTTNINDGAVLDLTCPFPDCDTEVLPSDIKALCSAETMSKFERFTVLAALRADPNARWCPNPECNNGIKYNAATMPWVFCNACRFEFCFHCLSDRHDGVPCGPEALAFVKKKKESEALAMEKFNEFAAAMKAFVKPCPTCNTFIEKNDGCNHMTCGNRSCGTQFCWLCLSLYTDTHFADSAEFPDCYDRQYWTPPELLAAPRPSVYQQPRRRRFTSVAKKVGIFVGVGVAVVTLGVPAAVIGGPVYGCFKLHKRLKARRNQRTYSHTYDYNYNYDPNFVPPSPERIAEAGREARRLYLLEHS